MSFWHHLPRPIIGLALMDGANASITDAVLLLSEARS